MAEIVISCSSGCAMKNGSIRDRHRPVNRRIWRHRRPRQVMLPQLLAVRLNIFTLRVAWLCCPLFRVMIACRREPAAAQDRIFPWRKRDSITRYAFPLPILTLLATMAPKTHEAREMIFFPWACLHG